MLLSNLQPDLILSGFSFMVRMDTQHLIYEEAVGLILFNKHS